MPYLGWIIAIIVLGMLVYPFMQMIPTDKQKRQVVFRQAALKQGLHVSLRLPELPAALSNEYHKISQCSAYFKHAETRLSNTFIALRSNSNPNEWFWLNDNRPPAQLIPALLVAYEKLPAYCLAVEQNNIGSTLFFQDDLNPAEVTTINIHLNELNALISR